MLDGNWEESIGEERACGTNEERKVNKGAGVWMV